MNRTAKASSTIDAVPLTRSIGAEIIGVQLRAIDDEIFGEIRQAFLDHCMLVFRDQHLSVEEHMAFASRWGEYSISPLVSYLPDYPGVLPLVNRGRENSVTNNWHYDSTFLPAPPALTINSARQVPVGGDTMWSNQYLAYETLSAGLKETLAGRRVCFTGARLAALTGSAEVPSAYHPIVRRHPETGRDALFLGNPGSTVTHFEGMSPEESLPLLKYLYDHSVEPDRLYRHRFRNGDVVMWDNRCTMHYAVHDYGDITVRDLHRISIKGDKPVGPPAG
jgi:taurine dioxygenase